MFEKSSRRNILKNYHTKKLKLLSTQKRKHYKNKML